MALEQSSRAEKEKSVAVSNGAATPSNGCDDGIKASAPARQPRWTRQDILILLEGKKVVESRVSESRISGSPGNPPERKWAAISSYCRRHGVDRTLAQCRKRWSNLGGDFRKVRDWEARIGDGDSAESYWVMKSESRRENKLPSQFDRDIYEILDGKKTGTELVTVMEWKPKVDEEEEEAVFDSGRTAAADEELFSEEEMEEDDTPVTPVLDGSKMNFLSPLPISEKPFEPIPGGCFNGEKLFESVPGGCFNGEKPFESVPRGCFNRATMNGKQPGPYPEKESASPEARKRKRPHSDEGENMSIQDQMIKLLERNNKLLSAQLETQSVNCHLDREQSKLQGDGLITVLGKLVDALGRIADKL